VKFSDGSDFDAEDVIASFQRAMTVDAVASYRAYTRTIKNISSPAPGYVLFETKEPDPILLNSLSRIRIISSEYAKATSADFDSRKAAIGTGPFTLATYNPGSQVTLKRNEHYWGAKPQWTDVTLRMIPDNGARLAGLLSGELDVVEQLPFEGIEQVQKKSTLKVSEGTSSRVIYLGLNLGADTSPYFRDNQGKPLAINPLRDKRVREAMALSINRQAIVERVMQGHAVVAAQYLTKGMEGTSQNIEPTPFDIAKAKSLMEQAGFKDGFQITLQSSNGRLVNDAKIAQVIAQMFSRIGIKATVDVMPWSVYAGRGTDVGVFLRSWGVNSGETSNPINNLNATWDEKLGAGGYNFGRVSDPAIDEPLQVAMKNLDPAIRLPALAKASEAVFLNYYILPLYFETVVTGVKKNIEYTPRFDGYTLAQDIKTQDVANHQAVQ
jgi:peptide/nickel transport system substrate-binding protein